MNELAIKMNVFAQAAGRFILWFAGFIGLMLVCNVASAAEGGLQLSQTRVIFDARAKDTQATIKNNSGQVYLIKPMYLRHLTVETLRRTRSLLYPLW